MRPIVSKPYSRTPKLWMLGQRFCFHHQLFTLLYIPLHGRVLEITDASRVRYTWELLWRLLHVSILLSMHDYARISRNQGSWFAVTTR
mmetsp:Transcript_59830/g.159156  ORF Transcript_59830/g.159156 Transcript_59830/m.159156 type:complete len:88 (+) Transcript_59830:152-415(+)